jgi:hypothetical protein
MTTPDPLLDRFSDLNWPGKRKPVNRDLAPAPSEDPEGWDDKPVMYMYKGDKKEFFTISHLAAALGKSPVTIRTWENKGMLPRSSYRSPRPRREMLPGTERKGKRLWTREQILGILDIASKEGVILNGKPPTPRFAHRVSALFRKLEESD